MRRLPSFSGTGVDSTVGDGPEHRYRNSLKMPRPAFYHWTAELSRLTLLRNSVTFCRLQRRKTKKQMSCKLNRVDFRRKIDSVSLTGMILRVKSTPSA